MKLLALLVLVVPWELAVICSIAYLARGRWLRLSRISSKARFIGYISPLPLLMHLIANLRSRGLVASMLEEEEGVCDA
jgi:hypothetical protein